MKGTKCHRHTAVLLFLCVYLSCVAVLVLAARLTDLGFPQGTQSVLDRAHSGGWFERVRYGHVEAATNVALFIPIGAAAALLLRPRQWWVALAAAIAVSGLIEFTQLVALQERNASLRDAFCNSLGAALGVSTPGLWRAARRRRARHQVGTISSTVHR